MCFVKGFVLSDETNLPSPRMMLALSECVFVQYVCVRTCSGGKCCHPTNYDCWTPLHWLIITLLVLSGLVSQMLFMV